ncbi:alpha/beta fold hydrolase [Streptacidiphilus jiangxiensis]|uniref:Pimeloyl-ACP methyl ester carboxylesterase n=1 Tax=Streptacidiphilus jiangxiensis TaxID=235985 RepID=A0A1H7WI33_STRJI|nr:alpha/beta hydrolase [Streptacidiphilus jiangxiensis]SEM20668.1 Pimeloyl-ACP methyl ester carboxylesterase [Streptacidiphilus jiangxiensis]
MTTDKRNRNRRLTTAVVWAAATLTVATAVVGGTASASAPSPVPVSANANAGAKPTIILEHGAFADASSWDAVIKRLEADGYPVVAPADPLRGPAADAAVLRSVIDHIPGPKILVGHSYGGSVISEAGANEPQVKALVYVAAFLPAPGETALGLTGKFPGSTLGGALDPVTYSLPGGARTTDLYIRLNAFRHQFAADVPARQAALMAATQRPIAQSALQEPATVAAWMQKPSWDVVTTEDLNIPQAVQLYMARRAHAHITEVAASHSVAVSRPGLVAEVIEEAARATR